jgi:hypothetical protein
MFHHLALEISYVKGRSGQTQPSMFMSRNIIFNNDNDAYDGFHNGQNGTLKTFQIDC